MFTYVLKIDLNIFLIAKIWYTSEMRHTSKCYPRMINAGGSIFFGFSLLGGKYFGRQVQIKSE